jgi:hypothetical protein
MQVDPRGQRFGATITTVVLIVVLTTGSWVLLAAQALVFAVGAIFGLRHAPYGLIYKSLIRPRIGPPAELEDEAPPRFAQGVGLGFALVGTAGYALGIGWLGITATAFALAAAFLNAAFGFCLGCEMYLLIKRFGPNKTPERKVPV